MSNKAKKARNFAALSGGALVVAAPFVTSGVADATGYVVTNTNDDGAGSLREAIAQANGNAGVDTITFQAGVTGTITLTDTLSLDEGVTIQGPGSSLLALDGDDGGFKVFYMRDDEGETPFSISGLTVTGGQVSSYGTFSIWGDDATLTDVVITGNTGGKAGGVYFNGFYDGNVSTLTIVNCTISGNSSGDAGGVYLYSGGSVAEPALVIKDSTVSGNTGGAYGGGVLINYAVAGDVEIANSTISGNTAQGGGGIYINGTENTDADLDIMNSTIVGNSSDNYGGGLYLGSDFLGEAIVSNSVITGNTATKDGDDIYVRADLTVAASYSLIGEVFPVDGVDGVGNKTGDPMLGALADNGGSTKTHLPQAGSPLIDAGDPTFGVAPAAAAYPATDQRGQARVYNSRIDIGAVEVGPATLPPTGGSNGLMATLGAGLLALGGALHLTGRRKRTA